MSVHASEADICIHQNAVMPLLAFMHTHTFTLTHIHSYTHTHALTVSQKYRPPPSGSVGAISAKVR